MPTRTKVFFDTNIFLYAVDVSDRRMETARGRIAEGGQISVQVLNEFAAVARRKLKWTWPAIGSALATFRQIFPEPRPLHIQTHERALEIAARDGSSIYDSLLLASALEARCDIFLSEDMQHGRVIEERLTIRNPFAH